jgi:transposase-like protein
MLAEFRTLPQLFEVFKDEGTCLAYWEQIRWGSNVTCPHCNKEGVYKTNRGYKCKNKGCQKKFSATVGSIFENTKISLRTWFAAIYLCGSHKERISSLQLSRYLSISQSTAWFLLHRIRETVKEVDPAALGGAVVEAGSASQSNAPKLPVT